MALSKNKIKLIKSLEKKKFRETHQLFVAEGIKTNMELLKSPFHLEFLVVVENMLHDKTLQDVDKSRIIHCTGNDIKKISLFSSSSEVVGVYGYHKKEFPGEIEEGIYLMLDCIQDPGNLGTIIRIADWFGIRGIICSPDTVDQFNPKVVQSSMGSISRVKIYEHELVPALENIKKNGRHVIYGTSMEGTNVYHEKLATNCVIILGNEGKGLSAGIKRHVDQYISIPSAPGSTGIDSLNVSVAAGIFCSEYTRINQF